MIIGTIDWAQLWLSVVWIAIASYFGLGVAITIGGFFDVIKMFRRLEEEHAEAGRASRRIETFDVPESK